MESQTFKEFLIISNLYQVHILLNSRSRFIISAKQEKVLYSVIKTRTGRNPRSLRDTSQRVGYSLLRDNTEVLRECCNWPGEEKEDNHRKITHQI